jgi:hypothetical protein
MATVAVFVDDAVRGQLPGVCAKTGEPSDGWLTLDTPIGRMARIGTPWLALLLVPFIGWLALLVLGLLRPDRSEILTIEVPWTESAQQRIDDLRRRRRALWCTVVVALAWTVAVVWTASQVDVAVVPGAALAIVSAGAAVAAYVGVLVVEAQLGKASISVSLDASRRWVTLGNVAPRFRDAVVEQQRASDSPHR